MNVIEKYLQDIDRNREIGREVVHREDIPPRSARLGRMPDRLVPGLAEGLAELGIEKLYSHQSEAVDLILQGEDVVVVTPTASGKTLCYNIPVVNRCAVDSDARALYLFPIKALGQDQLGAFKELTAACGLSEKVGVEIYDGDTTSHRRAKIRRNPPSVVISNPDMLHAGMLAYHDKWESFFKNLEFVVLDEVHTYRGVFGSHVAHVLRRLFRVAALYGSRPQVIACSATIANPGELAQKLVGRAVKVVDGSGAPEAGRHFLFVNPRALSASTVAARLLRLSVRSDLATIVFTKARRTTELVYTWAVQSDRSLRKVVSAYRAGYLPEERREIEHDLFSGKLKGVVTTSALEMGIDIGVLDVCVLVGYPGAITTTWQRGGRVGRQDRDSLIVLIAGEDALDQYFMKHPRVFFDTGFEPAVIDPENRPILKAHLVCAAAESMLGRKDEWYPDELVSAAVKELDLEGKLIRSVEEDSRHAVRRFPQRDVNIRGIGESFTIFEESGIVQPGKKPRVIGSLDGHRSFSEGHPGAIYLHRSRQYQVTRLDLEKKNIWARPETVNYYTMAQREKETAILDVRRSRLVKNFVTRLGNLKVTERITGYEKKRVSSGERLSCHELDLPPQSFETVGFWIEIDDFIHREITRRGLNFMGGIHAVEHAAIALFPLFSLCERDDVGGISTPLHPQPGKAAIFIYDGYPGGVGLAEQSFARIAELLEKTLSVIDECECESGCPACIYSSKCGSGNVPLDKEAASLVLSLLLDRPDTREWAERVVVEKENTEEIQLDESMEKKEKSAGPKVIVLDIETCRGAQEVGGWGNSHLMGMAVAVLWDSESGEYSSYFEEQAEEMFEQLRTADLVVGFNIIGFDYKVLSAYDDGTLKSLPTFDMLYDVHRRLGFRVSLAKLAETTLGSSKSADGLQSLEWVREGRLDLVEEYCRKDVEITSELFRHGLEKGWLRFRDREGRVMEMALDWDLEKLAGEAKK